MENTTLAHYGIKGMKWGVRRTEAQLARARGKTITKTNSTSEKNPAAPKKKSLSEMSDEELRRTVDRLNLEARYRQLNPEKVSAGRRFINKVMNDVVVPAATEVAKNALKNALQGAADSLSSKATSKVASSSNSSNSTKPKSDNGKKDKEKDKK